MAPKGSAFLHVRRDLQALIDPLVISHGWTPDHTEPGPFGNSAFIDRLEMQGTRDPAAFLTVPDAIAFRAAHDWPRLMRAARQLADDTEARMSRITGLAPFSSPAFRAPQMAALRLPRTDPRKLQADLMAGWQIEIPCFDWQDNTIARISTAGYTTPAEADLLVSALKSLLTLSDAA
jgi:isopenicillin-N epimerase